MCHGPRQHTMGPVSTPWAPSAPISFCIEPWAPSAHHGPRQHSRRRRIVADKQVLVDTQTSVAARGAPWRSLRLTP